MVFSSFKFIFIFMPIFFGIYYIVPGKARNIVLLFGSLIFYFIGALKTPEHMVLLLFSILLDFYAGLLLEKFSEHKKLILWISIILHLICIGFFKYGNFIAQELSGNNFHINVVLPLGISFYTFQGISYIADVYRGTIPAEQSLLKFSVYISMFEQLIAGPIVTYRDIKPELDSRVITKNDILNGLGTFIFGLGLKVLLANPLGKLFNQTKYIGFESISTALAWLAAIAFSLQLFLDFYGYSIMAQGLGEMLGFKIPRNFNFPYISCSVTEFWRRWHISLGNFFREYVYIPLGGNRRRPVRVVLNLLIVWILTGIWHGAGYNFLLWGLILFAFITMEKYLIGDFLKAHKIISRIYMLILIPLTWSVFAITDIGELTVFFGRLFPFFSKESAGIYSGDFIKYLSRYYPFIIIGIFMSLPFPYEYLRKLRNKYLQFIIIALIFLGSLYCMYRGFDDPFLYFRF